MEGFIEICGTPIEIKKIKEFRIVKREYIYRPVYEEIQKKNILGTTTKYLFQSMEPYAAILGQSNGGFLWQKKKYECINAAGRELYIELEDVPVLIHQADGHSSEVFREDPNYELLGKEKTPNIEYVEALFIKGKEDYTFYGNNIHLFSVLEAYNKVKAAVEKLKNPENDDKKEKAEQQESNEEKTEKDNISKPVPSTKIDLGDLVKDKDNSGENEDVKIKCMDYQSLIGELGDQAFSFLMDSVYPLFDFRVIKKNDVRKIDLIDILMRMEDPANEDWEDKKGITYYLFCLKQYIDEYPNCQEGSKAEEFKNGAVRVLEKALEENADLSEKEMLEIAENVFVVFISLFRAAGENLDTIKDFVISDVSPELRPDDAELLKQIWEHEDLVPDGISDKGGLFGFMKSGDTGRRGVKLTYFNNMIMLCRGLQKTRTL